MWGRSTGTICGARSKGRGGSSNPKAKKKIASKHRRIRREKTENFWHHLALALIAWAHGNESGSGAGGSEGDEGADREGEVQEDAAAFAELLEHYDFPSDSGSQGEVLWGSLDLREPAEHVPGVSGMRQGGRPAKGTRPGVPLWGEDEPSRGGGGEHRPQGGGIPRGLRPSRQGSVGDPGGRSSGLGIKPKATTGIRRKPRKSYIKAGSGGPPRTPCGARWMLPGGDVEPHLPHL
jgi:hypothetical protein